MSSTKRLLPMLLLPAMAFGQRGGGGVGHVGGAVVGRATPARVSGARSGGTPFTRGYYRGGYRNGNHYGYYTPYLPFYGGDEFGDGYAPEDYPVEDSGMFFQSPAVQRVSAPPKPASSVMHEYKFNQKASVSPVEKKTFTIVLKDGSAQSTVASWVQSGKLYYLDARSRQQVIGPDAINRAATEQANERKNLRMDLPPG